MLIGVAVICEFDASGIGFVNVFVRVSKVDFDICNGVQRPETGYWNFS